MKEKKKIYITVLIFVALLILGGCFWNVEKNNKKDDRGYITKQKWIYLLSNYAGANKYTQEIPYFKDINVTNEYYAFVQSAVEWGFIEAAPQFNGEEIATGKFIVISAMKSLGECKIQAFLKVNRKLKDNDYLDVAIELELIDKKNIKKGLTESEAKDVLERLDRLYFEVFWPENYEKVEYKDSCIFLDENTIVEFDENDNTIKSTQELQKGDVISFRKGGFVIIRRISDVLDSGLYKLDIPELDEVFLTLKQSGITEVSFQNIIDYYGLGNLEVSRECEKEQSSDIAVLKISANERKTQGFKIDVEEQDGNLHIYVTDNDTKVRYRLPQSPKVTDQYRDFSASIDVKKILIGSQIDYSAASGLKYADIAIDIETDVKAGIAAEDEISDRVILFETATPIGSGLIGADIQICLVTTLKGEVYLEVEIPFQTVIHYEKDKGIRKIQHELLINDSKISANAEMENKLEVVPILVVGGFVPVLDIAISTGVLNKVSVVEHANNQICTDAIASFPIMDISVGQSDVLFMGKKTLLAMLGWSATWNIFDEKNSPQKIVSHYEILPNGTGQFVEKCTYDMKENQELSENELVIDFHEENESEELEWTKEKLVFDEPVDTYGTRDQNMPTILVDFPNTWTYRVELGSGYEYNVIKNRRGVEISFYSLNMGFGSPYYGGGYIMDCAYITKVANASFVPKSFGGKEYDSLGKFIVAKIKVYAYIDGMTGEDKVEYDGATFYAVVPEDYLGDVGFKNHWPVCSFDYVRPMVMLAEAPQGEFTEEEEADVIRILASYRVD